MSVADHFAGDERDLPAEVDPETGLEVDVRGEPGAPPEPELYLLCVACGWVHEGAAWSPEYGWHDRLAPRS
jgi:hypothetical protein